MSQERDAKEAIGGEETVGKNNWLQEDNMWFDDDCGYDEIEDVEDWLDEDDNIDFILDFPKTHATLKVRDVYKHQSNFDDLDDDWNTQYETPDQKPKSTKDKDKSKQANPGKPGSAVTDFILLLFKLGLVVVFLGVIYMFFFGITQARDASMSPAVKEGDICIYYHPDRDYQAGDVIALEYNGTMQTRRAIATAGDTVDITSDGNLVINGSTQIETAIYEKTYPYTEGITFPVTVGNNEVFVLGDSREDATDSRIYGCVSIDATNGTVVTVIRRRGI